MALKGYQGWANWQTWNIALYLNNDEPLYRAMQVCARETRKRAIRNGRRYRKVTAEEARGFVCGHLPNGTADMRDGDNPTNRSGRHAMLGARWGEIARVINDSVAD